MIACKPRKISNKQLLLYHKKLEINKNKSKIVRIMEIIKLRAEINDTETKIQYKSH